MNELLAAVAHEVAALGVPTEVVLDAFPEDDRAAYVIVPHEYFACVDAALHPTREQLARTIAFCIEQPGRGGSGSARLTRAAPAPRSRSIRMPCGSSAARGSAPSTSGSATRSTGSLAREGRATRPWMSSTWVPVGDRRLRALALHAVTL